MCHFFILFLCIFTLSFSSTISIYVTPIWKLKKTNLCPVVSKFVSGGTITSSSWPTTALAGKNISVGIIMNTPHVYMNISTATGKPLSGFSYTTLSKISKTLSLTMRYVLLDPPLPDQSWTDYLLNVTQHVDIFASKTFADTTERRMKGLGFFTSINDASLVLITQTQFLGGVSLWNFTAPFTNELWGGIILILIINTLINWRIRLWQRFLKKIYSEIDKNNDGQIDLVEGQLAMESGSIYLQRQMNRRLKKITRSFWFLNYLLASLNSSSSTSTQQQIQVQQQKIKRKKERKDRKMKELIEEKEILQQQKIKEEVGMGIELIELENSEKQQEKKREKKKETEEKEIEEKDKEEKEVDDLKEEREKERETHEEKKEEKDKKEKEEGKLITISILIDIEKEGERRNDERDGGGGERNVMEEERMREEIEIEIESEYKQKEEAQEEESKMNDRKEEIEEEKKRKEEIKEKTATIITITTTINDEKERNREIEMKEKEIGIEGVDVDHVESRGPTTSSSSSSSSSSPTILSPSLSSPSSLPSPFSSTSSSTSSSTPSLISFISPSLSFPSSSSSSLPFPDFSSYRFLHNKVRDMEVGGGREDVLKEDNNNNDDEVNDEEEEVEEEEDEEEEEEIEEEDTLFYSFYTTFANFSSGADIAPTQPSGFVLTIGWSFFVLIIMASYTANLASFLVQGERTQPLLNSLSEANSRHSTICIDKSIYSLHGTSLIHDYPSIQFLITPSFDQPGKELLYVNQRKCIGAILSEIDWKRYQGNQNVNPTCNLVKVGNNIRNLQASFVYREDLSSHCTSSLSTFFNYAIVSMSLDNSLNTLLAQAVGSNASLTCSASSPTSLSASSSASSSSGSGSDASGSGNGGGGGSGPQLNINSMAGIFIIYALFVSACSIWHLSSQYQQQYKQKKE